MLNRCYANFCLAGMFLFLNLVLLAMAHAQDLEPRAYSNTPVGMNFLLTGFSYSNGGLVADPAIPLGDADIDTNSMFLGYMHAFDLWGMSSNFSLVAPYAFVSGSAKFTGQQVNRDVSGFADPRFQFTVNFLGAPALSLKEFAGHKQDLIMGASLKVKPPVGQYDSSKLVNIGTNRWSFEPGIGIAKEFGSIRAELSGAVSFYSDNTDYLGGQTLETDPIYSVQGHIIYNLKSGIWFALDGTYYWGGLTTVNGIEGDTLQENTRVGGTVALPIDRHNSIKLYGTSGVATRTGSDFDTLGLSWQYRWGGGL